MNRHTIRDQVLRREYGSRFASGKTIINKSAKIHMKIDYLMYNFEYDDLVIYFDSNPSFAKLSIFNTTLSSIEY